MGLTVNSQNKLNELFKNFALDPKKPREEKHPKNNEEDKTKDKKK
ncbi:SPJ_0845 family protein [Liquorilactobacillus oeni]|nr:SPJ_0845 family protein [Liquorilactobacillus oeni]